MRTETITKTFNIYKFDELSDEAKENVKRWYLEGQEGYIFTDMCEGTLADIFNNSDLKVQYSLSYCQGDGLNIYGTVSFYDLLEVLKDNFTEKEKTELNKYFEYCNEYKLDENNRYCYCIIDRQDFTEDLIYNMEDDEEEYSEELLNRFNKLSKEYLYKLCSDFEKDGYKYFYEMSDDVLREVCDCNGYEFTEDGTIY